MQTTTYSEARRRLGNVFDRVCKDREPMRITRREGGSVIVLSEEEYASLEETAYLLRSPANAQRLLGAIERDRRGERGKSLDEVIEALDLKDHESADAD